MAKIDILARVDADLARGHTFPATQRLASLIADDPGDLELRARLAAVHRQTGNLREAGRWGYLTEDVTPAEVAAFTKAFGSARTRLNALRPHHIDPSGLGPLAAARYAGLRERAAFEAGDATSATGDGPASAVDRFIDIVAMSLVMGTLCVLAALMGLGLVTVVRWFL